MTDHIEHRLRKYTVTTVDLSKIPAVDLIHYADGRVRLLSDLISGVEATVDPPGHAVGGIWVPDRGSGAAT